MGKKRVRKSVKRRIAKKKANKTQNNPSKPVEKINQLEARRKEEEQRNMMLRALGGNATTGSGGAGQTVDLTNAQQQAKHAKEELKREKEKNKEMKEQRRLQEETERDRTATKLLQNNNSPEYIKKHAKDLGEATVNRDNAKKQLSDVEKIEKINKETAEKIAETNARYRVYYEKNKTNNPKLCTPDEFEKKSDAEREEVLTNIKGKSNVDLTKTTQVESKENQDRRTQLEKLKDFGYRVYKFAGKLYEVGKNAFPWLLTTGAAGLTYAFLHNKRVADALRAGNFNKAADFTERFGNVFDKFYTYDVNENEVDWDKLINECVNNRNMNISDAMGIKYNFMNQNLSPTKRAEFIDALGLGQFYRKEFTKNFVFHNDGKPNYAKANEILSSTDHNIHFNSEDWVKTIASAFEGASKGAGVTAPLTATGAVGSTAVGVAAVGNAVVQGISTYNEIKANKTNAENQKLINRWKTAQAEDDEYGSDFNKKGSYWVEKNGHFGKKQYHYAVPNGEVVDPGGIPREYMYQPGVCEKIGLSPDPKEAREFNKQLNDFKKNQANRHYYESVTNRTESERQKYWKEAGKNEAKLILKIFNGQYDLMPCQIGEQDANDIMHAYGNLTYNASDYIHKPTPNLTINPDSDYQNMASTKKDGCDFDSKAPVPDNSKGRSFTWYNPFTWFKGNSNTTADSNITTVEDQNRRTQSEQQGTSVENNETFTEPDTTETDNA